MIKQTSLATLGSPFESILRAKNIMMTSAALNPITTGAREKYRIRAGTVVGPVGNGFVAPIIRSRIVATAPSNSTAFYVDDASGFKAGDVLLFYNALTGTASVATVSTVTEATNLVTMTAVRTAAAGDFVEVQASGAHGNTTAAVGFGMQTPGVYILKADVDMLAADGATVEARPCIGVDMGAIRTTLLTGSGTATFDAVNLRAQLPLIQFITPTDGS